MLSARLEQRLMGALPDRPPEDVGGPSSGYLWTESEWRGEPIGVYRPEDLVDAARFETGGERQSHLRGQVARHFHAHADLTNFGRRPYHRVVPSSGLRAPLMGHTVS